MNVCVMISCQLYTPLCIHSHRQMSLLNEAQHLNILCFQKDMDGPVTSVRPSIVRFVKLKVYHLPSQKLNSKCRIFQYLLFFVLFDGPLFYCNLCFRENKYRNSGNTIFLDQICRYLARSINKLFTKLFISIYFTDL